MLILVHVHVPPNLFPNLNPTPTSPSIVLDDKQTNQQAKEKDLSLNENPLDALLLQPTSTGSVEDRKKWHHNFMARLDDAEAPVSPLDT
jgi:hypothetical protein